MLKWLLIWLLAPWAILAFSVAWLMLVDWLTFPGQAPFFIRWPMYAGIVVIALPIVLPLAIWEIVSTEWRAWRAKS